MSDFIKFRISSITDYVLNSDNIKLDYQSNEFSDLKNKLNESKNKLDEIPEKEFSNISQKLDAYRTMKHTLILRYKMQLVTNATIKIYEIISQMKLINSKETNVFCNAELPGSFIVGINHYIKTMYKNGIFRWVASSYLSDTGTLGDNYGIFENNRTHWLMDRTMNGDLTEKNNIIELTNRVFEKFPNGVDLYTSDAGFDVSTNYNEQEEQTLLLNYGQILSGLFTLKQKGSFVTKQFTYFTSFNKSLISLLTTLFDELYIIKPVTSRPLNSEIYIIGKNFKGISSELKEYLLDKMDIINPDIPLILTEYNDDILESAKAIYNKQIDYINYAFRIYNENLSSNISYKQLQEKWLTDNKIYSISNKDYISYSKSTYSNK